MVECTKYTMRLLFLIFKGYIKAVYLIYIMAKLILGVITLLFINSVLTNHHGLQFLSDEPIKRHHNIIRRFGFTPQNFSQLVEGFIQGLEIFNTTHAANCTAADFEPINSDLANIIGVLKNFTFDNRTVDEINEIADNFKDIMEKLKDVAQPCQEYGKEIAGVIVQVIAYASNPDYFVELPVHILTDLSDLRDKFNNAEQTLKDGQFHDAGYGFGDVIYEAFLWNYQ
jgi:hypothetical protein